MVNKYPGWSQPKEFQIQTAVSNYINSVYPGVIFFSDLSGLNLNMGQAIAIKKLKCSNGIPDLTILEPKGKYFGLLIEIKRTSDQLVNKKGELRNTQHIKNQSEMLDILTSKGYLAAFSVGYEGTIKLIDKYMKLKPDEELNL